MIKKITFCLGMGLIFIFSTGIMYAQSNVLTIPAHAFKARICYSIPFEVRYDDYSLISTEQREVYAPVYLPQNTTIDKVIMSCDPQDENGSITFELYRVNLRTLYIEVLFSGTATGSGHQKIVDSILNNGSRIIDNTQFCYVTKVYLSPDVSSSRLYAFIVRYH